MLVDQSSRARPSLTICMNKQASSSAPLQFINFHTSDSISSGPGAFPCFIFLTASMILAVVIGGTGPWQALQVEPVAGEILHC